jgi:hypothetical protein
MPGNAVIQASMQNHNGRKRAMHPHRRDKTQKSATQSIEQNHYLPTKLLQLFKTKKWETWGMLQSRPSGAPSF